VTGAAELEYAAELAFTAATAHAGPVAGQFTWAAASESQKDFYRAIALALRDRFADELYPLIDRWGHVHEVIGEPGAVDLDSAHQVLDQINRQFEALLGPDRRIDREEPGQTDR
jgi:hypothetical protein